MKVKESLWETMTQTLYSSNKPSTSVCFARISNLVQYGACVIGFERLSLHSDNYVCGSLMYTTHPGVRLPNLYQQKTS